MKLASLHHITMITGHAWRTVDFYVDLLGMRLIKKNPAARGVASCGLGIPASRVRWEQFDIR